jgi:predicted dehydrogenase
MKRRSILKASSVLLSSITILPYSVKGANDKLNLAYVGAGGKGLKPIQNIMEEKNENVVAFADVDWRDHGRKAASHTFKNHPQIPKYKDFRKMLDKHKEIDAVAIAIPDHAHYYVGMYCMKAGKDIYLEKPMCHTIPQVKKITETAKKLKRITQMGNQGHSSIGTYLQEAWVKSGKLGEIKEVYCWTNRPNGSWGVGKTELPPKENIPEGLDWELWLNQAAQHDYSSAYVPGKWRGWYDFGCGALGDMGCHILDASVYSLDLGYPEKIKVKIPGKSKVAYPETSTLEYYFPKTSKRGPVKLTWFDGVDQPPITPKHLEKGRRMGSNAGGQILVGTEASIMGGSHSKPMRIIPEVKMKELYKSLPEPKEVESKHWQNWFDSCKSRKPANSDFEYASKLTEIVLLGALAQRMGADLEIDPKKKIILNNPTAQKLLEFQPPRKGWEI